MRTNKRKGIAASKEACQAACTHEPNCGYFLWKDNPKSHNRFHCAIFIHCRTTHPYADGSGSMIFAKTSLFLTRMRSVFMEPNPKKVSLESYMSSDLSSCSCHSSSHGGCQGVGTTTIVSHLLLPRLHESEWGASLVSMQHLTSLFPMIPIVIFADRKWADMAANAHPLGPKANSLCVIRMDIAELPETWYAK